MQLLTQSWMVLAQMAPYLLFGFAVAGVLSVALPSAWVEEHLGGEGLGPVLKSACFGVPLPLCSCSVIPVTASIRRHGASRASTVAFLLSTPQTGVDSILATYALLGPVYAVFRAGVAFLTGLFGGVVTSLVAGGGAAGECGGAAGECGDGGECGGAAGECGDGGECGGATGECGGAAGECGDAGECSEPCCGAGERPRYGALRRALRHGFVTLPGDLAAALLVGVLVAGVLSALVPPDVLAPFLGGGLAAMCLMMLVGAPIYVCATASIPIALGFMHLGASPGAALAFLIAGPATNAATFSVVWKLLGRRAALVYFFTVAGAAVGGGLLLDVVLRHFPQALPACVTHSHGMHVAWWQHAAAVILLALLVRGLLQKSAIRRSRSRPAVHPPMAAPG